MLTITSAKHMEKSQNDPDRKFLGSSWLKVRMVRDVVRASDIIRASSIDVTIKYPVDFCKWKTRLGGFKNGEWGRGEDV